MSFQVENTCYESAVQAAQVVASKLVGSIVQVGGSAVSVDVASVTASSIVYSFTPLAGGAAYTVASPFTPQPCNMLSSSDGLEIGWMVGGAWLAVYALLFVARSLRGETGGEYGNS